MEEEEGRIDVSRWPDRNPFDDRGPIHVPSLKVTVLLPYTGDQQLWKMRPSTNRSTFPRGNIMPPTATHRGCICVVIERPSDEDPEAFKRAKDETLDGIRFYIDIQQKEIVRHNDSLPDLARSAVRARRDRLERHEGIARTLNIPLRTKDGAPETKAIPIKSRPVTPLPQPPKGTFKAEPGIADETYAKILNVIRHEARTFEASPTTFANFGEEQLRDILMAHLNGHFEGGASGEAFRRSGKTDLRIEEESRAAFVAECKIWRGAKMLTAGVDQLLGYLTWRDCKAALIIFNTKKKSFTELLETIPSTLRSHPNFVNEAESSEHGEWHMIFRSCDDEARRIIVHTFVLNLYVGSS